MIGRKRVIVTGGLGFIGSKTVDLLLKDGHQVVVIDKCTYAANIWKTKKNVEEVIYEDISKCNWVKILKDFTPNAVINYAAESAVDASINNALAFIESNVKGVYNLLDGIRKYQNLTGRKTYLIHISTDERYGDLDYDSDYEFVETDPHHPNNPYSATKSAAELIIEACNGTYNDFDYSVVRGCNNYGPGQHCEKFVPLVVKNALNSRKVTIHGDGRNVREWIYVDDFARAAVFLMNTYFNNPRVVNMETFNVGSGVRVSNLHMAKMLIECVGANPDDLIAYVENRPGNDKKYAINSEKIRNIGFFNLYTDMTQNIKNVVEEMRERYGLD